MAQQKIIQTAGHDALGDFAPEFARLNDDILFGEVWSRNDLLSLRDRSLVTVTSLISQGITDSSLIYHLKSAKANGITRTEISEAITHIAFYAGWPKAWAAFNLAKTVWNDNDGTDAIHHEAADALARFQRQMIFPVGVPNEAYAAYFTGKSYIARISDAQIPFANVTFEPRCRKQLAHTPFHLRRRTDACGRGRPWMVSGKRPTGTTDTSGHNHTHPGQCETLARGRGRQLVRTPGI